MIIKWMVMAGLLLAILGVNAPAWGADSRYELETIDNTNAVLIAPDPSDTSTGRHVAWVGDVNGDSWQDFVIIGNHAWLVFGKFDMSAGADLAVQDGQNAVFLPKYSATSYFLHAHPLGDFNGDGIDDFLILMRSNSLGDIAVVVFGQTGTWPVSLNLADQTAANATIFDLPVNLVNVSRPETAIGIGDINDDGYDDFAIGMTAESPNGVNRAGQSHVVFGGPGPWPSLMTLADATTTSFYGVDTFQDMGLTHAAGDINGDGRPDLIIGAQNTKTLDGANLTGQGVLYVVFGTTGVTWPETADPANLPAELPGFAILGPESSARIGKYALDSNFDFNGDGIDDILIGTTSLFQSIGGDIFVVPGRSDFSGTYAMADHMDDFLHLKGMARADRMGEYAGSAGDVNADGKDDIMFWRANPTYSDLNNVGGEYDVVYGFANMGAGANLAQLTGGNGFTVAGAPHPAPTGAVHGYDARFSLFGGRGRDLNKDGHDDLLMGTYFYELDENLNFLFPPTSGDAWVMYGPPIGAQDVPALVASTLPGARSGYLGGGDITVFMTIINGGTAPATNCSIHTPVEQYAMSLSYAETDPATNVITGALNAPFDLGAGKYRTFVLAFTPIQKTLGNDLDVYPAIFCDNGVTIEPNTNVNSAFITITETAAQDILSISATNAGGGIIDVPLNGTGFMSVSAVNIGKGDGSSADDTVTQLYVGVSTNDNDPLTANVCKTDEFGVCTTSLRTSLNVQVGADPAFFAVFVDGQGEAVPLDPGNSRVKLRFYSATGSTYSITTAAVRTVAD